METSPNKYLPLVKELFKCGLSRMKKVAGKYGHVNPVGNGDAKTGAPSTYRPVGATCPETCAYLGHGCYAQGGNVNLHQVRASPDVGASIRSAAVGLVWAVRTRSVCRLHVSGDFVVNGRIDHAYITQLGILCDAVREGAPYHAKVGETLAWSYTHIPYATFEPYQRYLARKGVNVRFSDHMGPQGAIVSDFSALAQLREDTGLQYIRCPAQLPQGLTCIECKLCWEKPSHTVVFEPHGIQHRKVRASALRVIQS